MVSKGGESRRRLKGDTFLERHKSLSKSGEQQHSSDEFKGLTDDFGEMSSEASPLEAEQRLKQTVRGASSSFPSPATRG